MNSRKLTISDRYMTRQFRRNIKGDLIRAIVELLTNAFESYRRIEEREKIQLKKKITLILKNPKDKSKKKELIVIDNAEGMDENSLYEIIEYGKATSGILEGMPTRGYFGIGLKDSCYALGFGEIFTKKNHNWNYVKFFLNDKNEAFVKGPISYKPTVLEETIEIPENKNGTKVIINISKKISIPRYTTLKNDLLNNVCLRDIFTDENSEIFLRYGTHKEKLTWKQEWENVETLIDSKAYITYNDEKIPIYIKIFKANTDLNWTNHLNSERGLIIRSLNAIHEITLFNRHSHMSLRNINGVVTIPFLDELLKREEEIITQSRDGIEWKHPFTILLQELLIEILERIDIEEQRKKHSDSDLDDLTRKTLRDLEKTFKEIFRSELEEEDLPEIRRIMLEHSSGSSIPDFGFKISKISIYKNIETEIEFFMRKSKYVKDNDQILLHFDKNCLEVNPSSLKISNRKIIDDYYKIILKIKGKIIGTTYLDASYNNNESSLEIKIVSLEEMDFNFNPNEIKIPIGTRRKIRLFVNKNKIKEIKQIFINSNNPRITINKTNLNNSDLTQFLENYYFIDFYIRVSELCHEEEEGIIEARVKDLNLQTQVKIVCYKPDINPSFFKPDIDTNIKDPELPVELDNLFGKIIVYARHNTVYSFWKDDYKKIHSNIFKLRLADLFIDKLIDALISIKFKDISGIKYDDYESEKRLLYRKYGSKIFDALGLL